MNRDEQIAALAQEFRQIMRDRPEGLAERAFWDNLARDCAGIAQRHIDAASRVEVTDELVIAMCDALDAVFTERGK